MSFIVDDASIEYACAAAPAQEAITSDSPLIQPRPHHPLALRLLLPRRQEQDYQDYRRTTTSLAALRQRVSPPPGFYCSEHRFAEYEAQNGPMPTQDKVSDWLLDDAATKYPPQPAAPDDKGLSEYEEDRTATDGAQPLISIAS